MDPIDEVPMPSPAYESAKMKLRSLKDEYASRLAHYVELNETARRNLETEYMMTVGRKEYKLFSSRLEIRMIREEIAMRLASANRGKPLSIQEAEQILKVKFASYREELAARKKMAEDAEKLFESEKLSLEETAAVKKIYLELVKKLHPDVNPDLPPQAKALWNRIQEAYHDSDWKELYLLSDMADDLLAGKAVLPEAAGSMDFLEKEIARISGKLKTLETQIEHMLAGPPFTFRDLLNDPDAVREKREKLDQQIELCELKKKELQSVLDTLRRGAR